MLPYDTPPSDSQTPDIQITPVQDSGVQEPGVPCQGTPGPADARSVASELDASSMAASRWQQLALALILLLAAGLRLWRLDQNGYGNSYYAAAVRSMLLDWGNFLFGSYDPAGFIPVDKPPVAIWIQALSAKLLGYHGFTLLLPQALLGVGSVLLVYYLVRRIFGVLPGLIAGLAAAITPIGVAVDRDNLPDSALVFVLLLATWAWSRAAETGRLSRLLLAAALVGIGFNVKMLAAFVVLPTLYLVYLVASPLGWKSRVAHLTLATLVLGLVSLSWSIVVELTPKDRRPYIGGSKNNSAIELALGYNGFGRVFGGLGNFGPGNRRPPNMRPRSANARNAQLPGADNGPPNRPNGPPPWDDEDRRADRPTQGRPTAAINTNAPAAFASRPDNARPDDDEPPFPPGAGPGMPPNGFGPPGAGFPPGGPGGMPGGPPFGGPGGPGGPGGGFGGPPGFLRFARVVIAGQITWLFPLAIIGALVAGCRIRWRRSVGPERIALLVWAGWLATHWVTFSFAQGIFHEYYTIVMGPAVAALAGIGVAVLWDESGRRDWRRFLLPATLLVTGLWQCYILTQYAQLRYTLVPVVLGGAVLGAAGLVAARWLARRWPSVAWGKIAATCGVAALLIGPATWSLAAAATRGNAVMPAADPSAWLAGPGGRMGMRFMPPLEGRSTGTAQLVAFLRANHRGERYFVAAPSSMEAAQIIIETGEPAIALADSPAETKCSPRMSSLRWCRTDKSASSCWAAGQAARPAGQEVCRAA